MKKILFSLAIAFVFSFAFANQASSQTVTNDFHLGNWNYYYNQCWGIGQSNSLYYTKVNSQGTSGSDHGETTNLGSAGAYGNIVSPWITMDGNDQITFSHALSAANGTRTLRVYLISYPSLTEELVFTYNYPVNTTIHTDVITHSKTGIYKVKWNWTSGSDNNSQCEIDNITIGGTLNSDPSNGCNPLTPPPPDTDNDGVPDAQDAYPTDQYRAYNNYYPASDTSTLAFEDLWPNYGDYDMNDLVIGYKFKVVTNAASQVVEIYNNLILRACGASLRSGFGYTLPNVNPTSILSVTGQDIIPTSFYDIAANGTENAQPNATIIVFERAKRFIPYGNTDHNKPESPYKRFNLYVKFMDNGVPASGGAVTLAQLNIAGFNPFIVIADTVTERGREVHLPNYPPTALANLALFGTGDDDSNPAMGRYYKSAINLPWALDIADVFDYPIEKSSIMDAYNYFAPWAQSSGVQYPNWYMDLPGHRNAEKIY